MNVFQWIAGLVQQSLTTNTIMEMAGSVADIYYDHKRVRSSICLASSLIGAGGGATLCILQPTLINYFTTQAVPFLGTIAGTMFAGFVGAWFGGGVMHNLAKEVIREVADRNVGHSNTAYVFNDDDVSRIVDENPQIFNQNIDIEQGLEAAANLAGMKAQDVQDLKQILLFLRDQIDEHKDDGSTAHDEYKYALLSALRLSNLLPTLELFSKADTKREVRKQAAAKTIGYLADVDVPSFLGERQVVQQPRQPRAPRARRRAQAAQPQGNVAVPAQVPVPVPPAEPLVPVAMEPQVQNANMAVPQMQPNPFAQQRNVAVPQPQMEQVEPVVMARAAPAQNPEHLPLRGNVVFDNLRRQVELLNQGVVKDVKRMKRKSEANNREPALNPYQARGLLVSLKQTYQEQTQKQTAGRNNANSLLSKAFSRPGRGN